MNAGFTGLRTCGDMTWLLDEAPGSQQIVEYEAQLSQFFATVRALGMCQYNRHLLPGAAARPRARDARVGRHRQPAPRQSVRGRRRDHPDTVG
ncbi:MAG: MEDS domain-containing protein [Acidobacteria bacterium]|nr:MEDS domain-containing protein [Acidobacteriota bacterium]